MYYLKKVRSSIVEKEDMERSKQISAIALNTLANAWDKLRRKDQTLQISCKVSTHLQLR